MSWLPEKSPLKAVLEGIEADRKLLRDRADAIARDHERLIGQHDEARAKLSTELEELLGESRQKQELSLGQFQDRFNTMSTQDEGRILNVEKRSGTASTNCSTAASAADVAASAAAAAAQRANEATSAMRASREELAADYLRVKASMADALRVSEFRTSQLLDSLNGRLGLLEQQLQSARRRLWLGISLALALGAIWPLVLR